MSAAICCWDVGKGPFLFRPGEQSNTEFVRIPFQSELGRRSHIPQQRGRGDDRGARQVTFASDAHSILPVAVERRDRALPLFERVRPLTETGPAPRLADAGANGPEHAGDRLAAEPRVWPLDL